MNNDEGRDEKFVTAVTDFIDSFNKIAKAADVGRAIGLIDSKDWVIEEKNAEIAKLQKEKAELEQKTGDADKKKTADPQPEIN